jgi:hypothetical protein
LEAVPPGLVRKIVPAVAGKCTFSSCSMAESRVFNSGIIDRAVRQRAQIDDRKSLAESGLTASSGRACGIIKEWSFSGPSLSRPLAAALNEVSRWS